MSARDGIALCDVSIERSGETRPAARFGRLVLDVRDGDTGPAVPARVGLYDATGRAPLPSDRALSIHRFTDEIRLLRVRPADEPGASGLELRKVDWATDKHFWSALIDFRYHYRKKREGVASRQTLAVRGYRDRLKRGGWVRCEVKVRRDDVELIRTVAAALRDPDRHVATRALLRDRLGALRPRGFKELLASCPADLDLDRSRDLGRDIEI